MPSGEIVMPMDAHINRKQRLAQRDIAQARSSGVIRCYSKRALSCRVATSISGNASEGHGERSHHREA